jgi:predicted ester cyclase
MGAMETDRAELTAFYRRYNERCNAHRFEELGEFVAADVRVNDSAVGLAGYIAGLRAVVEAFPDYHWDLRRLLVDGSWLSAQLSNTGTHTGTFRDVPATVRMIATTELALYRTEGGKIVESWGDLGATVRDHLIPCGRSGS